MSTRRICNLSKSLLLGFAATILCSPAPSQEGARREIAAARERVQALLREAEQLQEAGRVERAVALRRQAEQLQERLQAALGRMEEEAQRSRQDETGVQRRRLAAGREQIGEMRRQAEELQRAGETERAAQLRREAEQLGERLRAAAARLRGQEQQGGPEGAQLQRRLPAVRRTGGEQQARGPSEELVALLRRGVAGLRSAGRPDAAEQLAQIVEGLQRDENRNEGGNRERRAAEEQLEVMAMASEVLQDSDAGRAAELLAQAVRARRAALVGRRVEAPSRGNQAEALMVAERILRERRQLERAEMVGSVARQLAERAQRERAAQATEVRPERERSEIDVAREQVRTMRVALRALVGADREDFADLLERAIVVRELAIEGRREEAAKMRESAPG